MTSPARWDHVVDTRLCTVIANKAGSRVATIEHLMAALHACGIDNAFIEIDHAEVPVMDGSSDPFMFLIEMTSTGQNKTAPRRMIEILSPVVKSRITAAKSRVFQPAVESSFEVFEIDFNRAPISQSAL